MLQLWALAKSLRALHNIVTLSLFRLYHFRTLIHWWIFYTPAYLPCSSHSPETYPIQSSTSFSEDLFFLRLFLWPFTFPFCIYFSSVWFIFIMCVFLIKFRGDPDVTSSAMDWFVVCSLQVLAICSNSIYFQMQLCVLHCFCSGCTFHSRMWQFEIRMLILTPFWYLLFSIVYTCL